MHDPNYDDSAGDEPEASDGPAEESKESETGLLPKAFFGDKELTPGNECKVRIEKVYDNQVAVSYVPHESSESEEPSEPSAEPETADNMYG